MLYIKHKWYADLIFLGMIFSNMFARLVSVGKWSSLDFEKRIAEMGQLGPKRDQIEVLGNFLR